MWIPDSASRRFFVPAHKTAERSLALILTAAGSASGAPAARKECS